MTKTESFNAKAAKNAKENNSLTAKAAMAAKENISFNAKDMKIRKNKSENLKDAKEPAKGGIQETLRYTRRRKPRCLMSLIFPTTCLHFGLGDFLSGLVFGSASDFLII